MADAVARADETTTSTAAPQLAQGSNIMVAGMDESEWLFSLRDFEANISPIPRTPPASAKISPIPRTRPAPTRRRQRSVAEKASPVIFESDDRTVDATPPSPLSPVDLTSLHEQLRRFHSSTDLFNAVPLPTAIPFSPSPLAEASSLASSDPMSPKVDAIQPSEKTRRFPWQRKLLLVFGIPLLAVSLMAYRRSNR